MCLANRVVTIALPGSTVFWVVDDTLCRKRGLTLYGAGMHYDPLISSRAKSLVSWGHDWLVLCLILVGPFWAPTKVFALPIAARLYRNRHGLTRGKKGPKGKKGQKKSSQFKHDPDHRTRPELALQLINLVAQWFPNNEIIISGDSAYGGQSILSHLPPGERKDGSAGTGIAQWSARPDALLRSPPIIPSAFLPGWSDPGTGWEAERRHSEYRQM